MLIAGVIVHEPLSRVPENTLKFGVGVMLTSFGIFWSGEGAGVSWPGGDVALLGVIAFVASRRRVVVLAAPSRTGTRRGHRHEAARAVRAVLVRLHRR